MEEQLLKILTLLNTNKISVNEAQTQILDLLPYSYGIVRWYDNLKSDVVCENYEVAQDFVDEYNKLSGRIDCYVDEDVWLPLNKQDNMKTKTIEVCDAIAFYVSCKHNDSADIRCGGPALLEYDFIVSPDEDVDEMTRFIKKCIKKYNRAFIGISINSINNFPVIELWTKEAIEKCIKEHGVY
jgi:hypothetical protein